MTAPDETETAIVHQVAFIFDPSDDEDNANTDAAATVATAESPSRRRKHNGSGVKGGNKRRKPSTSKKPVAATSATLAADAHNSLIADDNTLAAFPPLLQGRESPEAVARRSQLYSTLWSQLDARIQSVLQRSNDATLTDLVDFVDSSYAPATHPTTSQVKLPAAFVVLGPAATTDMLLFRQLASSLVDAEHALNDCAGQRTCIRRMVRLRASETPNLRAALKTIVQEATTITSSLDDDVVANDGRKYLAYDLEAVAAAIPSLSAPDASDTSLPASRIVVAFEDCEAFDGALLADLISFLHSWLDRIPFVLLFGVATSIDLFQGRLPKQAAHRLAAAQFDVAPSSAVLDKLVRCAVAAADVPLRLGPALVRTLAERQDEQVTGVSVFVNSLKYAYMCYFYANPLSVFLQDSHDESDHEALVQALVAKPDNLAAIRQLPSFRRHVEALAAAGNIDTAQRLLRDDDDDASAHSTLGQAVSDQLLYQRQWTRRLARALHIASVSGVFADQSFTELYIAIMEDSTGKRRQDHQKEQKNEFTFDSDPSLAATMTSTIRRMPSSDLTAFARRLAAAVQSGDEDLALLPVTVMDGGDAESFSDLYEARWAALGPVLLDVAGKIEELEQKLKDMYSDARYAKRRAAVTGTSGGVPQLRSKYTAAQSKAVRTTVVAQKVQLSRDSAALTDEDQTFTEYVDTVAAAVASIFDVNIDVDAADAEAAQLWLQEIWLYDARTPYRDVFIPRPGLVVERALARPHDYLACDCCGQGEIRPTLPPTAILYQLYQDAGPLVNVADLWEAFQGAMRDKKGGGQDEQGDEDEDEAVADDRERRNLVKFYQGLSEMKTLGYIKPTRRKVDHVAKIKWL